jgi:lipoprotein-anchoring transpeptidase ErfK/SrfK
MRAARVLIPTLVLVFAAGAVSAGDRQARPKAKPRPAAELIKKQDPPKVVPRVLDRATPDNTSVTVSISRQRAAFYVANEVAIDTPVSTGKRRGMTPPGSYTITEKSADHRSNIYGDFIDRNGRVVRSGVSTRIDSAPSGTRFRGAPMKYFMRLTDTGIGLHVGALPGYPASHGCIRLPADIAPLIYQRVKLGTPVRVEE